MTKATKKEMLKGYCAKYLLSLFKKSYILPKSRPRLPSWPKSRSIRREASI
ncbi:hypothetical protein SAMD00020551_1874 [Mesobacillus selenatarsenatis SF-1]|uniref:Uncharacterized protein n=1 Tax=Mesobacillus selenatarsenatis (strain DSM 18680 / JCM 14380 / FERM P-15431 / SF-1) TaxID=1321606 RepID=A0A0A8X1B0_MESS1|nr:hypothetical protein SAMD00020551_1874 [Mesobacillus selenatarsenatis SF-1]